MADKKKLYSCAIITGAGGLLGYHHSEAMIELGYVTILTDINKKKLEKQTNLLKKKYPKAHIFNKYLDVTNEKILKKTFKSISKQFNIKVLINNASINSAPNQLANNQIENFDIKKWNREIKIGLTGYFLTIKHVIHFMKKNKNGIILNIGSDLSEIAPDHRIYNNGKKLKLLKPISYSVVKHGVVGITKYIAALYANYNLRCNCVSPGGVENNQSKKFISKIKKIIPLGRMAKKNEYKGVVKFLCSEQSSYLTGQNIVVDGGRSII